MININEKKKVIENLLNSNEVNTGLNMNKKQLCNLLEQMRRERLLSFRIPKKYEDGSFDPIDLKVTLIGKKLYLKTE